MNATNHHKEQESYDLISKNLELCAKRLSRETLTPEEVAELQENQCKMAESSIKPAVEIQDEIAKIRKEFPPMSSKEEDDQREVFKLLYEQKVTGVQARHLLLRKEQRRSMREAFDNQRCHLAWVSYLQNSRLHFPPRPIQTRLAVHAARKAGILTLYGGSELGKTTAAIRGIVLRGIDQNMRKKAVAVSGMTLSRMSAGERSDFVERVTGTTASLLLDDIDKGGKAEGVSSAILEIIEAREHMDALTIITTNCNADGLSAKLFTGYGDPIVSRIRRGILIKFDDEDIDEVECRNQVDGKLELISRQPSSATRITREQKFTMRL